MASGWWVRSTTPEKTTFLWLSSSPQSSYRCCSSSPCPSTATGSTDGQKYEQTETRLFFCVLMRLNIFLSAPLVCALVCINRRKSQQAEREYEKVKHQLENLEESVRDRCKKEFTGRRSPDSWDVLNLENAADSEQLISSTLVLQLLAQILIFRSVIDGVDVCLDLRRDQNRPVKSELTALAKTLMEVSSVRAKQQTQHPSAELNLSQYLVTHCIRTLGDVTTVYVHDVKSCQHNSAERTLAQTSQASLQVFSGARWTVFSWIWQLCYWASVVSRLFSCQTFPKRRLILLKCKAQDARVLENNGSPAS